MNFLLLTMSILLIIPLDFYIWKYYLIKKQQQKTSISASTYAL